MVLAADPQTDLEAKSGTDAAPTKQQRRRARRRRVARRTISVLPTLFTLGNLLAGFGAVFTASRPPDTPLPFGWSPITFAALLVLLGMILDGLDGRIARLTRSFSDLGEQLDSMADMVTFGVAPAFIVVQAVRVQTPFIGESAELDTLFDRFGLVVAMAFVACAGLRLARFNVELNQADEARDTGLIDTLDDEAIEVEEGEDDPDEEELAKHLAFRGLPSPAAAGAVVALALLHQHFLHQPARTLPAPMEEPGTGPAVEAAAGGAAVVLIIATLLCALLMISRIRYVHLVNRYVRRRAPFGVVAGAVVAVLLMSVRPQYTLALAFTAYAVSGVVGAVVSRKRGDRSAA